VVSCSTLLETSEAVCLSEKIYFLHSVMHQKVVVKKFYEHQKYLETNSVY